MMNETAEKTPPPSNVSQFTRTLNPTMMALRPLRRHCVRVRVWPENVNMSCAHHDLSPSLFSLCSSAPSRNSKCAQCGGSEAEAEVGKCEMGWVHLEIENATLLIARRHAIYCR